MAKRTHYHMNPLAMGLLGGVQNWAQEMEKYNLINAQNQARLQQYNAKYSKMADVATLRAQNNAMIAKLKQELPQKQYTQVLTDGDGNKVVSMGHMIADPANPDKFIQHEDTRMSLDEYNKFKGGGRTAGSNSYTLSPGQKRLDADGNVIAEVPRGPDPQAAMMDRQNAREDALNARSDKAEKARIEAEKVRDKALNARLDTAEKRRINSEAARSTNAAMKEFDTATPQEQAALAKSMGVEPMVADPDAKTMFGNPKEGATKANDALRKQYRDAVHKQALEESTGASEDGTPAAETGDTTSVPADDIPDIRKGADGKFYKVLGTDPDGKIRAVPLKMHEGEAAEGEPVAQAGPDDEENEPAPDNEPAEGESDPFGGLIDAYQKQSDAAMAKNQDALASADEEPQDEDSGLLMG